MSLSVTTNLASGAGDSPATITKGASDPNIAMYGAYNLGAPVELRAEHQMHSLVDTVYDPHGPGARPRSYQGAWVNPADTTAYAADTAYRTAGGVFKYNQMMMTVAQNFDPFMQKKVMDSPHWWLTRIPRGAYPLFSGTIHETRIFRGGLGHYAGLADWEDLAPDPTVADPCAPMPFKTYQYAWETLAWSGKKTAWGSDPICIDSLKFTREASQQLGWILETGVKFGIDIQNVWNRDMFIYYTVLAGRSYVMTSTYRGDSSPRYFYNPFIKFAASGNAATLTADNDYVSKPFIVFDASIDIEPLNFDVLDLVRMQLKRRCGDAAVGSIGNEKLFAIAVAAEDVEKYIRGNEEERRYWIEADPNALIKHYGFAPTTFRRWVITDDDNQLRFKVKAYWPSNSGSDVTDTASAGTAWTTAVANKFYGGVGKELAVAGKPVYVAEFVEPEIGGRPGINGTQVPVPNTEYDFAELAIAPIFMNNVFTNLFVPDLTSIAPGSGTWFGPKKGLNGKWGWYNIQTPENPDNKIGNFKGEFHIVPRPETCVYDAISFLYRRCAQPLPSLCPTENLRVNVTRVEGSDGTAAAIASGSEVTDNIVGAFVAKLAGFTPKVGDTVRLYTSSSSKTNGLDALVFGTSDSGAILFQVVGIDAALLTGTELTASFTPGYMEVKNAVVSA